MPGNNQLDSVSLPQPPTDDHLLLNEEQLTSVVGAILKWLQDYAVYDSTLKEALSRGFINVDQTIETLNVNNLIANLARIITKICIGPELPGFAEFCIDGTRSLLTIHDGAGVLRLEMGLKAGVPVFNLYDEDGKLTFSLVGTSGLETEISELEKTIDNIDLPDVPAEILDFDDWESLKNLIPFNKIEGVTITKNMIQAGAVLANLGGFTALAAGVAKIISLNADRITVGQFDPARLPSGAQPDKINLAIDTAVDAVRDIIYSNLDAVDRQLFASSLIDDQTILLAKADYTVAATYKEWGDNENLNVPFITAATLFRGLRIFSDGRIRLTVSRKLKKTFTDSGSVTLNADSGESAILSMSDFTYDSNNNTYLAAANKTGKALYDALSDDVAVKREKLTMIIKVPAATPGKFDPNTFDWSTLTSTIPYKKITGVSISGNQIAAGAVLANIGGFTAIAAGIAKIIELNADRITLGVLDTNRLPSGSRPATISTNIRNAVEAVRDIAYSNLEALDTQLSSTALIDSQTISLPTTAYSVDNNGQYKEWSANKTLNAPFITATTRLTGLRIFWNGRVRLTTSRQVKKAFLDDGSITLTMSSGESVILSMTDFVYNNGGFYQTAASEASQVLYDALSNDVNDQRESLTVVIKTPSAAAGFDPDTFDWSTLTTTIPFNKITGTSITSSMIATGAVLANIGGFTAIAAGIASIIELNANRITAGKIDTVRLNVSGIASAIQLNASSIVAGEIDANRLTADVKNVDVLYSADKAVYLFKNTQSSRSDTNSTTFTLAQSFKNYSVLEIVFIIEDNYVMTGFFPTTLILTAYNPTGASSSSVVANRVLKIGRNQSGVANSLTGNHVNGLSGIPSLLFQRGTGGSEGEVVVYLIRTSNTKIKMRVVGRGSSPADDVAVLQINGIRGDGALSDKLATFRLHTAYRPSSVTVLPDGDRNTEDSIPNGWFTTNLSGRTPTYRLQLYRFGEFEKATTWRENAGFAAGRAGFQSSTDFEL